MRRRPIWLGWFVHCKANRKSVPSWRVLYHDRKWEMDGKSNQLQLLVSKLLVWQSTSINLNYNHRFFALQMLSIVFFQFYLKTKTDLNMPNLMASPVFYSGFLWEGDVLLLVNQSLIWSISVLKVIQRRKSSTVNFYRGWSDYKSGFGDVEDNHWLGKTMAVLVHNIHSSLW